ncbi:MAG: hypothetical protein CMH57_10490 [Myxococcales bacterium]|nr:hypothetical protein [Myxococcales bacterium]
MRYATDCDKHPDYLNALTEADGEQRSLPAPPPECPFCARTHALFVETSEVLRWREEATEAPLSADWQVKVWLQLAEEEEATAPPPAIEAPTSLPRRSSPWAWVGAMAAVLVAVLAAVAIWSAWQEPAPVKTPRRSQEVALNEQPKSTHVALRAYSLKEDKVETLAPGSRIAPGDRLSFDYLNVPGGVGDEMRYLTVVALVRSREAQHRAMEPGREDLRWIAQSEPIEVTHRNPRVLGAEDIAVDAPPGELTIFGVFSRRPLSADQVEEVLLAQNDTYPLPGVGVARLPLRVEGR